MGVDSLFEMCKSPCVCAFDVTLQRVTIDLYLCVTRWKSGAISCADNESASYRLVPCSLQSRLDRSGSLCGTGAGCRYERSLEVSLLLLAA